MNQDIKAAVNELNSMIQQGKALEAFEKFYDESVDMQENDTEPRRGKAANREYEKAFFSNVTEWKKANVKSVSIGENTAAIEWEFEFVHAQWGTASRNQVAVQTWRNGKIVFEKFYYAS